MHVVYSHSMRLQLCLRCLLGQDLAPFSFPAFVFLAQNSREAYSDWLTPLIILDARWSPQVTFHRRSFSCQWERHRGIITQQVCECDLMFWCSSCRPACWKRIILRFKFILTLAFLFRLFSLMGRDLNFSIPLSETAVHWLVFRS